MRPPKVFLSSVVDGLAPERDAAARAVSQTGCQVLRCEDFGALPISPRQACFEGVDEADVVVALFAKRWGSVPAASNPRKLSVTALEVERARAGGKHVLVFLMRSKPQEVEPELTSYLTGLSNFTTGLTYASFATPLDAEKQVKKALLGLFHRSLLAQAVPGVAPGPEAFRGPAPLTASPSQPAIQINVKNVRGPVAVSGTGSATAIQYGADVGRPPQPIAPTTEAPYTSLIEDLRAALVSLEGYQRTLGEIGGQVGDLLYVVRGLKNELDLVWSDLSERPTDGQIQNNLAEVVERLRIDATRDGRSGAFAMLTKDVGTELLGHASFALLIEIAKRLLAS